MIYFLVLVFLNTALFEDFRPDLTTRHTSYQPDSLVELVLELFSSANIPTSDEPDDFSYLTKLPARTRYSVSFFALINSNDWHIELLNILERLNYFIVFQEVSDFGGTIFFNEILLAVHHWKLF